MIPKERLILIAMLALLIHFTAHFTPAHAQAPLQITTPSLPDGTVGESYSQTLQATGGTLPYSWSLTSGNLPTGFSLNPSSGVISGTPTVGGVFNFTVEVRDSEGRTATQNFSITIPELILSFNDLSPGAVDPGNQGVPMFALGFGYQASQPTQIVQIKVPLKGDAQPSDISAAKLLDVGGQVVTTASFNNVEKKFVFDNVNFSLPANATTPLTVAIDIATNAVRGRTIALAVDDPHQDITFADSSVKVKNPFSAQADTIIRPPVIVIPGILGSTLDDTIPSISPEWPVSAISGDPRNLQFDENGTPRTDTNSANLIPIDFIDSFPGASGFYDNFVDFLKTKGYKEDETLFKFPYDWRRPIQYNAAQLMAKIETTKALTGSSKVDLVAHSMGGMVAIEMINQFGASDIGTLIMVGTPHLGAPQTLAALRYADIDLSGIDKELGKRAIHNMPGVYDLLPSRKYVEKYVDVVENGRYFVLDNTSLDYDGTQGKLKTLSEVVPPLLQDNDPPPQWTLNPNLLDKSEMFHNEYDRWKKPDNIKAYVIAGHGQATIFRLWQYSQGIVKPYYEKSLDGDGTVPLDSATAMDSVDRIYYADLLEIRDLSSGDRGTKHSKMLSGDEIQQLILSLLNGIEAVDIPHITTERPNSRPYLELRAASPVRLDVYDSVGRHTGIGADGLVETAIQGVLFIKSVVLRGVNLSLYQITAIIRSSSQHSTKASSI